MSEQSLPDVFKGILSADPVDLGSLGEAISDECGRIYRATNPDANLQEIPLGNWTFLFDFSSEVGAEQWDRTVVAWGTSTGEKRSRDESYQRGYPSPNGRSSRLLDKGHMVPHQAGGDFGPNIFPQDRELNRGWSPEGKRYRALEREVGSTPGNFFMHRLIYRDHTDFPAWLELGVVRDGELYVERFRNRFD